MPSNEESKPADQSQQEEREQTSTRIVQAQYVGPLPLPSHLREYDEIVPGAADRIISMTEAQSDHRRQLEKAVIIGDTRRAWAGVAIGGFLALCCIGGGIFLAYVDKSAAGTTIATSSVVGLAAVFVYGSRARSRDREKRDRLRANTGHS